MSGDDYQYLVAWSEALRGLLPQPVWKTLELEASVAKGLDDVVLDAENGSCRFLQAKYAVDQQHHLDDELLTTVSGRFSLLQRLYRGWTSVSERSADFTVELVTNRVVDPTHVLLQLVDQRDDSFRRIADSPPSKGAVADALLAWSTHLGVEIDELLAFLRALRLRTGLSLGLLMRLVESQQSAAGLDAGEHTIRQGVDVMRQLVTGDVGPITPADLEGRIAHLPRTEEPYHAVIAVEAIDDDPLSVAATHSLRWRDHYQGDTVDQRVVPRDGEASYQVFAAELSALQQQLKSEGSTRILVSGAVRLASWFALGYALRSVDGFSLTVSRGAALTRSTTSPSEVDVVAEVRELNSQASDAVVVVAVSLDPQVQVDEFRVAAELSAAEQIRVTLAQKPGVTTIRGDADAAAVVEGVRAAVRQSGCARAHLFLACPAGVAALLGHLWHRICPVTVYEHTGRSYTRAYSFS